MNRTNLIDESNGEAEVKDIDLDILNYTKNIIKGSPESLFYMRVNNRGENKLDAKFFIRGESKDIKSCLINRGKADDHFAYMIIDVATELMGIKISERLGQDFKI